MTENPSIMSHISIGTNDFKRAVAFYDAIMPTVGAKRILQPPGIEAVGYGKQFPEFWVQAPHDGGKAEVANGIHIAFLAATKQAVHAFWDAAIGAGATADGEPGPRPHYGEAYYACFVRDLDGHKLEAMYWDQEADTG